ncbi:Glycosyl transferase family 2 [Stieleria maiorica]|uniref:Glycosyl transferase family 2 n=1 Tax=Stieleria maiorica TaxID=2795974 RepID=A0A5B9MIM9_9BACT|nr:glycosyltransferase family A protein [Stieleria maiorica]QEF99475.1 Glycosyl transferase family 2 [Stieleria maiorica]
MPADVSIVIPTLGRDAVLVATIKSLLGLSTRAAEILIVDQTAEHDQTTRERLTSWNADGTIRWIRLSKPSITRAMNHGLMQAHSPRVLFLDDDIRPRSELVRVHDVAHQECPELWASVGQVIQPWQQPQEVTAPRRLQGLRLDEDFPFHSTLVMDVHNVMAGNLCVNRQRALSIGGFDENFQGAAYRFETEFARRVETAGGSIRFLGNAGIDHLRAEKGGTRINGNHLTSASARHGVGDHYFAMLHAKSSAEAHVYCLRRALREVRTKFHLSHPWWIPVKLLGEVRAYLAARRLVRSRRAMISADANESANTTELPRLPSES